MNEHSNSTESEHDWAREALPWRLNDTISDADLKRLNDHLLECQDCRRELAAEQVLAREMRLGTSVQPTPEASLAKLKTRLPARERTRDSASPEVVPTRSAGARSQWFYGAVAAQVAVIAVVAGWLAVPKYDDAPYETMSSVSLATAGHLKVQFDPQSTEAQVRAALRAVNGQIVAGPSVAGVYRVMIESPERIADQASLGQAADTLMAQPAVRFASAQAADEVTP